MCTTWRGVAIAQQHHRWVPFGYGVTKGLEDQDTNAAGSSMARPVIILNGGDLGAVYAVCPQKQTRENTEGAG